MADPKQPGRPAPAAEPDLLGGQARNSGDMDGLSDEVGADGTPRDRGQAREEGEARPGRDENQAGFVRDRDKRDAP